MHLRKGQHVHEITKKAGQRPRRGKVLEVRGDTVEVQWDDGHTSSVTGALLVVDHVERQSTSS